MEIVENRKIVRFLNDRKSQHYNTNILCEKDKDEEEEQLLVISIVRQIKVSEVIRALANSIQWVHQISKPT